jgi:hypothetical protein
MEAGEPNREVVLRNVLEQFRTRFDGALFDDVVDVFIRSGRRAAIQHALRNSQIGSRQLFQLFDDIEIAAAQVHEPIGVMQEQMSPPRSSGGETKSGATQLPEEALRLASAQFPEAVHLISVLKPRSNPTLWKCPACGATLVKGSPFLREALARGSSVAGVATCSGCTATFDQNDVYSGKYDVAVKPLLGRKSRKRSTEDPTSLIVLKAPPNPMDVEWYTFEVIRTLRPDLANVEGIALTFLVTRCYEDQLFIAAVAGLNAIHLGLRWNLETLRFAQFSDGNGGKGSLITCHM